MNRAVPHARRRRVDQHPRQFDPVRANRYRQKVGWPVPSATRPAATTVRYSIYHRAPGAALCEIQDIREICLLLPDQGLTLPVSYVGRHRQQHRALDDCCSRRLGRCRARSYPYPHRRGSQPSAKAWTAHRPETKLTEEQQAEARKRRAEGATLAELARSYDVGKSTISRLK